MENKNLPLFLGLGCLVLICLGMGVIAVYFLMTNNPFKPPLINNPDQASTSIAQTVEVKLTQDAFSTLVAQLTQIAPTSPGNEQPTAVTMATPTLVPSSTAVPTLTPLPTSTPLPPTPIPPTPIPCLQIQFVSDVTIPDGTVMVPNQAFTKTWRLKNIGACTWTTGYAVVFVGGNQMSAPSSVNLPFNVPPGATVDVSVPMIAPSSAGSYQGNYELRTDTGIIFGLGTAANKPFWVHINVQTTSHSWNSSSVGNFGLNYCAAIWTTGSGTIACPSSAKNYTTGSVNYTNAPKIEGGHVDDEPTILVIPSAGQNGYITGEFPSMTVPDNASFYSLVGCMYEQKNCDVTFQLNYKESGSSTVNQLGAWKEIYDGKWTTASVDLSSLAGKKVIFYLKVINNTSSSSAQVFWLAAVVK